jgi:hypothetical protein
MMILHRDGVELGRLLLSLGTVEDLRKWAMPLLELDG